MERYFLCNKFNTWYDWGLILTEKTITPPEPNTNYVTIDGMNGSLDLSEALTGEVTYKDRKITAKFWTDKGTRTDRERLLSTIIAAVHGKKIRLIEPDDMDHYFYGRVVITAQFNNLAYATFTLEATCEPWRYALEDTVRRIDINNATSTVIIANNGVKTVCPHIDVIGTVDITYEGNTATLTEGSYWISDIKLRQGVNEVEISGTGSVTFTYKEATL
jgi:hypothetical protein